MGTAIYIVVVLCFISGIACLWETCSEIFDFNNTTSADLGETDART